MMDTGWCWRGGGEGAGQEVPWESACLSVSGCGRPLQSGTWLGPNVCRLGWFRGKRWIYGGAGGVGVRPPFSVVARG